MTVDFENLRAAGWSPLACAAHAESEGLSRLEAFKGVMSQWGAAPFAVDDMLQYGSGYPSRAAHGAATVGLAAVVLEYPTASFEEVTDFELETGISRKVEALARADRPDDALRFYDRLVSDVLGLTPVTQTEARGLVRMLREPDSPLHSVVIDSINEYVWGWIFSPRLDGRPLAGGRSPGVGGSAILLDRFTGVGFKLDMDEPLEVVVKRYQETGWPT